MIDPMLMILAPPAVVFAWGMTKMRSQLEETPEADPPQVQLPTA